MDVRSLLEQLADRRGDALTAPLAYLAAQGLDLDPEELNAARRRSLLLLASGGDPRRELDVDAPAVARLAADLDAPDLRERLQAELSSLHARASGLEAVEAALDELAADSDLALRWVAAALLAEELAQAG